MAALLTLALMLLLGAASSAAGNPSKNKDVQNLLKEATCGSCLRAGGAWCLSTDPPRCVPDGRGLCGAGGPGDHVGWAGFGRCPDPSDWQLQAYLHAPRRPPPAAMQQGLPAPECGTKCAASGHTVPLSEPGKAVETLERCGMVVLPALFDPQVLTALRDELVERQNLTTGFVPGHKLEMPGVRGSLRQELILPFRYSVAVLEALGKPAALVTLTQLLGHPPSIDLASLIVAWPGAGAQDYHRDAEPGTEAALLLFVPLDPTSIAVAGAAGPPEMCACSHTPGSPEECGESPPVPMATDGLAPLGSAVVYDSGLVHRGLSNPPQQDSAVSTDPLFDGGSTGGEPRLMLGLALTPHGAGLRGRPEVMMGAAAKSHVQRWRSAVLGVEQEAPAYGCGAFADCERCLAAGTAASWRTGCAWCAVGWDGGGKCVPDVAAACDSAEAHFGESGMGGAECPAADADADDGDYEEL